MPRRNALAVTCALSTLALPTLALVGLALAGPIDPPAGPVAGTYKTLDQIEPRIPINAATTPGTATAVHRITQPGSYYLEGDIAVPSARAGIRIETAGVTIDMRGHAIMGLAGSANGIDCSMAPNGDIAISNGAIRAVQGIGISAQNTSATITLSDLAIIGVGDSGVDTNGAGIIATRVAIDGAGDAGFNLSGTPLVLLRDCLAVRCNGTGFELGTATLENCAASQNRTGIALRGGVARGCTASGNTDDGFFVSRAAGVDCSATTNGARGFQVSEARLTGCTATFNQSHGFELSDNATIESSKAIRNTGSGIRVTGDACRVVGNHSSLHTMGASAGGVGIRVEGQGCHVQGNTANGNVVGIQATNSDNAIFSNAAADNSVAPFAFVSGNQTGPIGSPATATSPYANISY